MVPWPTVPKICGREKEIVPDAVPEQGHRLVSWQRRSLRWHFQCGSRGTRGQGRGRRREGTSPGQPGCSEGLHVGERENERRRKGRKKVEEREKVTLKT